MIDYVRLNQERKSYGVSLGLAEYNKRRGVPLDTPKGMILIRGGPYDGQIVERKKYHTLSKWPKRRVNELIDSGVFLWVPPSPKHSAAGRKGGYAKASGVRSGRIREDVDTQADYVCELPVKRGGRMVTNRAAKKFLSLPVFG